MTLPAGYLMGQIPTFNGITMDTDFKSDLEFKGEAEADLSNRLQGDISVTVVDVFPNGTLSIRGEKWITLNRGDEYIRISGLVRPDDVTPENTVLSTKIAHAQITYSGEGDIANSQRMGWLGNFFNSPIWPF
jgi:flagellar L-ring protein precursor FlgH